MPDPVVFSSLPTKKLFLFITLVLLAAGYYGWDTLHQRSPTQGLVSGNGRIEATEIDIATKAPGRVADVLVKEGEFVTANQLLVRMQTDSLKAQRTEADAGL